MSSGIKQSLENGKIMIIIFTPNFPGPITPDFQRLRGLSKIILPHVNFKWLMAAIYSHLMSDIKIWIMHNSVSGCWAMANARTNVRRGPQLMMSDDGMLGCWNTNEHAGLARSVQIWTNWDGNTAKDRSGILTGSISQVELRVFCFSAPFQIVQNKKCNHLLHLLFMDVLCFI